MNISNIPRYVFIAGLFTTMGLVTCEQVPVAGNDYRAEDAESKVCFLVETNGWIGRSAMGIRITASSYPATRFPIVHIDGNSIPMDLIDGILFFQYDSAAAGEVWDYEIILGYDTLRSSVYIPEDLDTLICNNVVVDNIDYDSFPTFTDVARSDTLHFTWPTREGYEGYSVHGQLQTWNTNFPFPDTLLTMNSLFVESDRRAEELDFYLTPLGEYIKPGTEPHVSSETMCAYHKVQGATYRCAMKFAEE